jgi:hypothetical protein
VPEAPPAPEPNVEAAPPAPAEIPPPAARYRIAVRLTTGDLVVAGEAQDADGAEALAQVVVADVATADESWPYVSGRYIRPETIVSVDILPAE